MAAVYNISGQDRVLIRRRDISSSEESSASDAREAFFHNARSLNRVKRLEIRIVRTEASNVPCLASLEVHGWASGGNGKAEDEASSARPTNSFFYSSNALNESEDENEEKVPVDFQTSVLFPNVSSVSRGPETSSFASQPEPPKAPIENPVRTGYVCALTAERASIPMVLPCGQIVDKSSLDKHIREEERWGRAPNDPFTGKPFTRDCKPLLLDS